VTWLVKSTVLRDDEFWVRWTLFEAYRRDRWNIVKSLLINTQVDVRNSILCTGDNSILHRVISFDADKLWLPDEWLDTTAVCRLGYVCGEDVNVQDRDGYTPLHEACDRNNSVDIVGALLLAGADETIPNDEGRTPVQWTLKYGRIEVLSLLDVSSKWKLLVRSHRLRRRTAVRVMMKLVTWKVQQTRSMWARAIITLHTIMALVRHEDRNCCWLNIRDCMFAAVYTKLL
jgi:hypothetical protein